MKKATLLILVLMAFLGCKKEQPLTFSEAALSENKAANIEIIYPKAHGNNAITDRINQTIENYVIAQLNINDAKVANLNDAITLFNNDYTQFKNEFADSSQKWEASIEGEVIYNMPTIVCIAINAYLNTGGAHGNSRIDFLNFNPQTGQLYTQKELIKDLENFSAVTQNYLNKEMDRASTDNTETSDIADYFFGKDFQLPESFGFSDEGLIILYNTYEIASYAQGITEFTIPYQDIANYLNIAL